MKIIQVDNFNRETRSDRVIVENIDKARGKVIVEALNENFSGPTHPDYYHLVEDDHKLFVFEP